MPPAPSRREELILFPYGGDIAVVGEIGVAEEALLRDYPGLVASSAAKRRRVEHLCHWADLVIRNYQYGFLPARRRFVADAGRDRRRPLDSARQRGGGR